MTQGSLLFITLGCAKNEVDTDRMRALLLAAGYSEVDSAADADAVIINTCSFLASATSESIETTLELAEEVKEGVRGARIIMCGCVPSRYGEELPEELPEVAAFVRTDEEDGIVAIVDGVLGFDMPTLSMCLRSSARSRAPSPTSRSPMAAIASAASAPFPISVAAIIPALQIESWTKLASWSRGAFASSC